MVMGLVVLIVMATQISWQLTLLSLVPMPIMAIVIKRYGDQLHQRFKTAQAAFSSLNDQAQESLTSIRMIKAFGLENHQSSQFADVAADTGVKNMRVARVDARFDPTIYVAIGMANLLAIGGGSWMVVNGHLTLGQLTSFVMYLGLMIWPMLALAWMFNIVERGSAAYSRIRSLLQEAPSVVDGTKPLPAGRSVLEAKIADFHYPETAHPSLTGVMFSCNRGKMLGLCGPTGSGKSTLLGLIQRQFDVTHGDVLYHGLSLKRSSWMTGVPAWRLSVRPLFCSPMPLRKILRWGARIPRRKKLKKLRVLPVFMTIFCACPAAMKLKSASVALCFPAARSSEFLSPAHCC